MEKGRDRLDQILEELARRGLISFPVTDEFVEAFERSALSEKLEDEEVFQLYHAARTAFLSEALRQARASLPAGRHSLGEILRHVLTNTKITDTELAQRVGIDLRELRALEENAYDPTKLPAQTLANLMELFTLKLGELVAALQSSMRLIAARSRITGVYARSDAEPGSRERGALLGQAVDALLAKAAREPEEPKVDANLIAAITQEVISRGREDLLT